MGDEKNQNMTVRNVSCCDIIKMINVDDVVHACSLSQCHLKCQSKSHLIKIK